MFMTLDKLKLFIYYFREKKFREALIAYVDLFHNITNAIINERKIKIPVRTNWLTRNESPIFQAQAQNDFITGRSISIGIECWAQIQGVADKIFSDSEMFLAIGDPSAGCKKDDGETPACPIRFRASCLVAEIALVFTFLHELGHHVLDHQFSDVSFLNFTQKRYASPAMNQDSQNIDKLKLSRIEEAQADHFAYKYIIQSTFLEQNFYQIQREDLKYFKEFVVELTLIAHAIVIGLLGGFDKSVSAYEKKTHPHPAVRFFSSLYWLHSSPIISPTQKSQLANFNAPEILVKILSNMVDKKILDDLFIKNKDRIKKESLAIIKLTS